MKSKTPAILTSVASGALSYGAAVMEDASLSMDATITVMKVHGFLLGFVAFILAAGHIVWSQIND